MDAETRQLLRDGSEIHLSPKAFDLLCSLIERRPKVVEKAELLRRIWPDTFVVDASLNVLIGEIRRALADDARRPRYVRTVHGVGYAFCGDARNSSEPAAPTRAMPCWLISTERTFRLGEGQNIIGRDPACAVWLDSPSVSRRHARLTVESPTRRVVLEDLDSTNGCVVRGAAVHGPIDLSDGDAITIGSVELRVYLWNAEKAAETARIPRKRR
ncbi:MAG: winged helix-turn-helix domain-containing protein [Vicinamibacterales bacterium]